MKNFAIRWKITIWYTIALILVMIFTCGVVLSASNRILQKTICDNLVETLEHNVDEIEFFSSIEEIQKSSDVDHLVKYNEGYLEIDDDFLDQVNEVYTSLYRANGELMYGENPISREILELKFTDSQIRQIKVNGILYYVFDRELTGDGLEGLWLRGIVSELQGKGQLSDIAKFSLILLPLLILFSVVGGYLIAKRMLRPIQHLTETVVRIEKGGDLKQRIQLDKGNDELHQLANHFNQMFSRLEESFEMERRFASDVSHELRTPMAVIRAQCEFSLEKTRDTDQYIKALQVIQRQSKKMSKLISDMLEFTRLEMRAEYYNKEMIDMTELVTSICSDMALLKEKGISLQYETQQKIAVLGNYALLSRLLINLISNAYRYGKEGGHIWVDLQEDKRSIKLSVKDDGIGIKKEEQANIFRRFYQADHSRSGQGTGLGLALAQEIAQFHGGRIEVQSDYGKGSKFTVILPRNDENNFY